MPSRYADDPRYKEPIVAQEFGKIVGYIEEKGLKAQGDFIVKNRETFQVTRRFLMIDHVNPDIVINFIANALDMSFQFAVVKRGKNGAKDEVLIHPDSNKIASLRYLISDDTEAELTPGSRKMLDKLVADFKEEFEKHMIPHIK